MSDHAIEIATCPYADRIRSLFADTPHGVAFQAVAAASLQTLRKVLARERRAAKATISLAQGEKLDHIIWSTEATAAAITDVVNHHGRCMINLSGEGRADDDGDGSWWFALTEAIDSIEEGTRRIQSLAAGQPKGGPARNLSSVVIRLLRQQHHQLLAEADDWIS